MFTCDQAPSVCDHAPFRREDAPVVCVGAPAVYDRAPALCEEAPAVCDRAPAFYDDAPAVYDNAPAGFDGASAVYDRAPVGRELGLGMALGKMVGFQRYSAKALLVFGRGLLRSGFQTSFHLFENLRNSIVARNDGAGR